MKIDNARENLIKKNKYIHYEFLFIKKNKISH
jgi:hypothetical protein